MKNLEKITKFDESSLKALLVPVWESKEILGETGIVIGAEGRVQLLCKPVHGTVVVKNIFSDVIYEEGVDYVVVDNYIQRVPGGNLPYFEVEDYFRTEPNAAIQLKTNAEKSGFPFEGERYVYFSEGVDCFEKYIAVSYKTEKPLAEGLIVRDDALQTFVEKVKTEKKARVKFYGDSITVGCNATGTQYGSNVSPFTPNWITLVTKYLEERFDAKITAENHAVGGWSSFNGIDSFQEKCGDGLAETDMLCIGFGANDLHTAPEVFDRNLTGMIDAYFAANPNGSVLLYSTLLPNAGLIGWRVNQPLFEKVLLDVQARYERIGVAKVSTVFSTMEADGKPTRDWLANSVNHPNDFGVRVYAQTILSTLLGENFYKEW